MLCATQAELELEQLGSDAPAEKAAAPCEAKLLASTVARDLHQASIGKSHERGTVDGAVEPRDGQRLVEPQAEQEPLAVARGRSRSARSRARGRSPVASAVTYRASPGAFRRLSPAIVETAPMPTPR